MDKICLDEMLENSGYTTPKKPSTDYSGEELRYSPEQSRIMQLQTWPLQIACIECNIERVLCIM